jgi:hypothetical protein
MAGEDDADPPVYTTLVGYGLNEAFVQGVVDMKRA